MKARTPRILGYPAVVVVCGLLAGVLSGCLAPAIFFHKYVVYGKVTDQNDDPVPDIEVRVGFSGYPLFLASLPVGERRLRTDAQGEWRIALRKVDYICATLVSDNRYDYPQDLSCQASDLEETIWSRDNPLVLHMRKRGKGTVLLHSSEPRPWVDPVLPLISPACERQVDLSQMLATCTLARGRPIDTNTAFHADLIIESVTIEPSHDFRITFRAPNASDGVILSDKQLFEAPEDGYGPSATVTVRRVEFRPGYLYVRSREPPLYTRIQWELMPSEHPMDRSKDAYGFYYETWMNPYGSRNLETAVEVDPNLWKELEREARTALAEGRRAEEPDLDKLPGGNKQNRKD